MVSSVASPGPARDEVAFGDDGAADPAGDRRGDAGELEVELSGRSAASTAAVCASTPSANAARRSNSSRDMASSARSRSARCSSESARSRSVRAAAFGAKTIDLGLEGPRIDLEQQVAATDDRAFVEVHGGDVARDARPDGDGVDGLEAAGEFIPLGDLARNDVRDRDLWGWQVELVAPPSASNRQRAQRAQVMRKRSASYSRSLAVAALMQSGGGRSVGSRQSRIRTTDVPARSIYDFWTRETSAVQTSRTGGTCSIIESESVRG